MHTSDPRTEFLKKRQLLTDALVPVLKEQLANSKVQVGNLSGTSYSKPASTAGQSAASFADEVVSFAAKFTSLHQTSHEVRLEFSVSDDGNPRVTLSADQQVPCMEYVVAGNVSDVIQHLRSSIVGLFDTLCAPPRNAGP